MKKFDYSFFALGTTCVITIVTEWEIPKNQVINELFEYVKWFEKEFSRFKEDSDLMKLNTLQSYEVSNRFLALLFRSREIFLSTEWFFNPLVDVRTIWYSHSFELKQFEKYDFVPNKDFESIKNYWNLVELQENMFLDFWSIAKWFLADLLAEKLVALGFKNILLNMWGDIKALWKNVFWKSWNIAITSPFDPNSTLKTVEISNKSISTSGTYLRNWKLEWQEKHHIINPLTGENSCDLLSVSIIDFHGYKTDAYATAILAMGKKKAIEFCNKNKLDYVLIDHKWEIFTN